MVCSRSKRIKLIRDFADKYLSGSNPEKVWEVLNDRWSKIIDYKVLGEYILVYDDLGLCLIFIDDRTCKPRVMHIISYRVRRRHFDRIQSENQIRRMLGFMYNLEEILSLKEFLFESKDMLFNLKRDPITGFYPDPPTIRVQGDILLRFFGAFRNTIELVYSLLTHITDNILFNMFSSRYMFPETELRLKYRKIDSWNEFYRALHNYIVTTLDDLCRKYLEGIYFIACYLDDSLSYGRPCICPLIIREFCSNPKREVLINNLFEHFKRFVKKVPSLERKLRIRIGRHTISLIGVQINSFFDELFSNLRYLHELLGFDPNPYEELRARLPFNLNVYYERDTFLIFREQKIKIEHPEHETIELELPPSIFSINSITNVFVSSGRELTITLRIANAEIFRDFLSRIGIKYAIIFTPLSVEGIEFKIPDTKLFWLIKKLREYLPQAEFIIPEDQLNVLASMLMNSIRRHGESSIDEELME